MTSFATTTLKFTNDLTCNPLTMNYIDLLCGINTMHVHWQTNASTGGYQRNCYTQSQLL